MKTGNLNGVDLTDQGAGTNFLADDGTYKATPSAPVDSVFSRTGTVVAQSGDYSADQVTNAVTTNTAQTITGQKTHTSQLTIQNVAQTNVLRLPSVTHSPSTGDIYRNGANNNVQGNWVVSNNITAIGNVTGKITKHTSTTNSSPANGDIWYDGAQVQIQGDLKVNASNINFNGLPTSSAGLSAGDLWNDSGTLKIV